MEIHQDIAYVNLQNFTQDRACEEVDYEVESSSGSEGDCEEGGGEGGGRERVCEEGGVEECEGGEGSSEEEEMERQRALSMAEKEKVVNSMYNDIHTLIFFRRHGPSNAIYVILCASHV